MKNFFCYFFLWIILIANSAVFANGICNISGVWVAYSPPAMTGFALLQEGDSTISGWWFPYPSNCDRPVVLGTLQENGQIFLQGYSSKNAGCEVMTMTAVIDSYNCDFAAVNLWSSTGEIGRYLYQKFPSHIEFTEPQKNTLFVISKEPKMPDIHAAVMIEYGEVMQKLIKQPKSLPFMWDISIEHTVKSNNTIRSNIPIFSTMNKEHQIDFSMLKDIAPDEGGEGIRGGKLTILVDYETGLLAKSTYDIQGTNPGKELIETVLTDPVTRGIACVESSYRQFEAKREGGIGWPVIGTSQKGDKCGVGLMQLCDPKPYHNSVWNWRDNAAQAMKVLHDKRDEAKLMYLTEHGRLNKERESIGLPACPIGTPPPLTPEQEDRETLRRYNCGREYRWEPRDAKDCQGQWVIKPYTPCKDPDLNYVDKVLQCKIKG